MPSAGLEPDLDSPRRPTQSQGSQKLNFGPAVKRREEREASLERRKREAEKLKEEVCHSPETLSNNLVLTYFQGNSHFKEGCYVEAIGKYNEAAKVVGMRPVIMSNLAAAYLKLEQYALKITPEIVTDHPLVQV